MEDLTGKQFGPYQVVAPLGEGGMAAVYRAYQASMDRYVALKVLPQYFARDPEFVGRFAQEAKVLAKLQHVHILPVHDFGQADGYTYIVMPFVQTGTLADLLDSEPLPLDQVGKIISQVGSALDYAHSQGVVHRDVKPSNILIDQLGNCLLTDFGIAKIIEGTTAFTQTGGIIGTPAYMSPEQIRGEKLDGRSDVYSLGVVLYEMATGRPPYKAETPPAIFVKHLHDPLPPPHIHNSEIPQGVERVILKALCKERDDRFDTPREMAAALARGIAGDLPTTPAKKDEPELPPAPKRLPGTEMGVPATRVRKEKRERRPFHLPKWVWGAAGGLLLVVAVIVLILVFGGGDGTPPTATDAPVAVVQEEGSAQRTSTSEPAPGAEDGAETFTVRFELNSSSDWLDVNLIWAQGDIVEGSTVETGGEPDEAGLDGRTINLDQEIERAEEGNELYLVEHVTLSGPVDGKLGVTISRGCIGRSRVNVYHLATGSPVLLQQTADELDCADSQYFSIPIATLLSESPPESPTPLPTESPGVALYEEGLRLADQGDLVGALARFDEAIATGWERGDFYHDRGIVCRQLEEEECSLEEELESYIMAIDLGNDSPGVYRDRGWAYANLGEAEMAIDDFNRLIEREPNGPHNWTARGDQYFNLGDIDAGLANWATAIDLEPQNADLHSSLGWRYLDLGDPNLAFESFSRAIELDPGDPWSWRGRGQARQQLGDLEGALEDHNRAIEMGPGDVYFFFDRGWVYWEMGETELAMADWDAAIEWEPDNPWNWSDRGWRFLDIGEYQLALDDFNQAIELDPETGWHYGNRAWAYWNMGEGDLALANMSRAIELSPDSAWRWHDRGNLYVEMGDFHAALEDFDRAISLGAQDSWFYSDRAWLFWEHLGEPELAIADWMAAIEMDPEQPWHYWDRAWAYSDLGDWDAARPDFEEFLRLTEHESEEYANDRTEAQNWLANH